MNWFKRIFKDHTKDHTMAVCPTCHVYFDPRENVMYRDDRFREYCDIHRKEKIAEQEEKDGLSNWIRYHKEEISFFRANPKQMKWIVENWSKLQEQYSKGMEKPNYGNGGDCAARAVITSDVGGSGGDISFTVKENWAKPNKKRKKGKKD